MQADSLEQDLQPVVAVDQAEASRAATTSRRARRTSAASSPRGPCEQARRSERYSRHPEQVNIPGWLASKFSSAYPDVWAATGTGLYRLGLVATYPRRWLSRSSSRTAGQLGRDHAVDVSGWSPRSQRSLPCPHGPAALATRIIGASGAPRRA